MTVVQVEEEVVLRYWEFPMARSRYSDSSGWGTPEPYFAAINDVGTAQLISFYSEESDLKADFPLNDDSTDTTNAELEMRLGLFQRMVGRLETQREVGDSDVGTFFKLDDTYVRFTTACGMEYRVEYADLKKLAWD